MNLAYLAVTRSKPLFYRDKSMKKHLFGLLLACSLVGQASAGIIYEAVGSGWIDSTGYHIAGNRNTLTGEAQTSSSSIEEYRSFWIFDIGDLSGLDVVSATLTIASSSESGVYVGFAAQEELEAFQFSTSLSAFVSPTLDVFGALTAFGDLGSGISYGQSTVLKPADVLLQTPVYDLGYMPEVMFNFNCISSDLI
jgi:hypothetical protein